MPPREDLEVAGLRVDPEDCAGKLVDLAAVIDPGRVEDAVPAVKPAVGAPGQRVGQLVGVEPAEAGDDDLAGVGPAVAVGVLEEEDVGRVGHPDPPAPDCDSRWDVQAVGEDGELVGPAVAVGVFEDLDPVAARPCGLAGVLQALGDPGPPPLVEGHRHRVDDLGLARHQLDPEPGRDHHLRQRLGRAQGRPRRPVLGVGDRIIGRRRSRCDPGQAGDHEPGQGEPRSRREASAHRRVSDRW